MPTLHLPPDLDLHYRVDDCTDPWTEPETILLLHGNGENGRVWYGWMPPPPSSPSSRHSSYPGR